MLRMVWSKRLNRRTRWKIGAEYRSASRVAVTVIFAMVVLGAILLGFYIGSNAHVVDLTTVASVIGAEILLGIMAWLFRAKPSLLVTQKVQSVVTQNSETFSFPVLNDGSVGAEGCDVTIDIDAAAADVLDAIEGEPAPYITRSNFRPIIEAPIFWSHDAEIIDIRPRRHAYPQVFRVVRNVKGFMFFVIPSAHGWSQPLVYLEAKDYHGKIVIGAMNCDSRNLEFQITFDEGKERPANLRLVA